MNKAILALDRVKAKLEAAERQKSEPIAVIGAACRFPGGGDTPEAFFRFLTEGTDAITQVPPDRWRLQAAEDAMAAPEGRAIRWGGFLREPVDRFDARFFGISPREAAHLDPQQRFLLEVGWEALERAGQDPARLTGSATGVFVGVSNNDYIDLCKAAGAKGVDAYTTTGNGHAFAAGRLSYALGFQGPSVTLDTACSSSLVAVHLACLSLRNGESTLALVGGVNLMLSPDTTAHIAATQALSPDGRCKTFDAAANGYVRSEGCGMVVLKLLSDAQRDGDPILALIRGSAVNQDGRSTGLTTPNVLSQQAMLRQALTSARVAPEEIGYIETHGTGTSLGDPIEFEALRAVVGQPRQDGSACVLGAAKSNIGHLEAAAGIVGLIKVMMAFREEIIPGNLHFRSLNPRMSLDGTPFVIPTGNRPWPRGERPRLAGVSSFGMSGTNAHVVLEEPPIPEPGDAPPREASSTLLPISAKSPEALQALAEAYADVLTQPDGPRLSDIAYTASVRRAHHEHRFALTGRTREEMANALRELARTGAAGNVAQGRAATGGRPRLVYVFSGQGSQWVGMGRQLLAEEPVFRAKLEQVSEILRRYVSWTLIDELQAPEDRSRLAETKVVQPALFGIQVALAKLLKSWGVRADAVIGHSVGEVAAAHVAGVLSLDEAARLVAWRGRIMQKATGHGKMVWVALPAEEAALVIAGRNDVVSIAAVNDPSSVVLSGDTAAIDEIVAGLTQQGIRSRSLRVNYAFHSPQMTPLAAELVAALGRIKPQRSTIPLYSTVIGAAIDGETLNAAYWARNVREPVQFARAVAAALGDGSRLFLEIGPHPVLNENITQCLAAEKQEGTATFTLRRNGDERRAVLDALAALYVHGVGPDWKAVQQGNSRCATLPTYPWQRERHWVDIPRRRSAPVGDAGRWPLSGVRVDMPGSMLHHVLLIGLSHQPFLADHTVFGKVVVPGAFHVAVILAIAAERWPGRGIELSDIDFLRAIVLDTDQEVELHTVLTPEADGNGYHFEVATGAVATGAGLEMERRWTTHARGQVQPIDSSPRVLGGLEFPVDRATEPVDIASVVLDRLSMAQIDWGPLWQWMHDARVGPGCSLSTLVPTLARAHDLGPLHPCLLDNCFGAIMLGDLQIPNDGTARVPFALERLRWWRTPSGSARCGARYRPRTDGVMDAVLADEDGTVLAEVDGFSMRRAPLELFMREEAPAPSTDLYRLDWPEVSLAGAPPTRHGERWVVVAARGSRAASALQARLERCIVTEPAGLGGVVAEDHALAGVVCVWEPRSEERASDAARRMAIEGLSVVGALRGHTPPRLLWVTTGAVSVHPGEAVGAAAAPMWGLGRTVMHEHPELGCTMVDLEAGGEAVDTLVRELSANDGENQVAWRAGRRHAARLVRASAIAAGPRAPLSVHGTVLLTGGLGGVGLAVARWLAQQKVPHLVLTGRRGLSTPGAAEAVAELEALGARVTVAAVDVADREALKAVIEAIPVELPLRGVIHAAGVLADGVLAEQDAGRFERVLSPKVTGAWNLHELTAGCDLDIFVMFSSIAALFGAAGQSNYAAANGFLDALAAHRRANGLAGQSLAWGPWAEVGMAAGLDAAQQARLARQGFSALSPNRGMALFGHALARPEAHLGLVSLDLPAIGRACGMTVPPVWRALVQAPATRAAAASEHVAWATRLAAMPEARRADEVLAAVRSEVARALSLSSASAVPADRPLMELGFDSLMAVDLRKALGQRVGSTLPATLAFDYPTPAAITKYLLDDVLASKPNGPPAGGAPLSGADLRLAMASASAAARSEEQQRAANIDDLGAEELMKMFGISGSIAGSGHEVDRDE